MKSENNQQLSKSRNQQLKQLSKLKTHECRCH